MKHMTNTFVSMRSVSDQYELFCCTPNQSRYTYMTYITHTVVHYSHGVKHEYSL